MKTYALLAIVSTMATIFGWPGIAFAQDGRACYVDPAQVPQLPVKANGVIVRLATSEQARTATELIEHKVGIKISPDYVTLPRVVVRVVRNKVVSETMAAVVDGHTPKPGENVEILSRYRDPRSHCNFIPWTVGSIPALS